MAPRQVLERTRSRVLLVGGSQLVQKALRLHAETVTRPVHRHAPTHGALHAGDHPGVDESHPGPVAGEVAQHQLAEGLLPGEPL